MNALTPTKFPDADAGHRRFVINMVSAEGEPPRVQTCEITSNLYRNRTSFPQNAGVNDVFIEGVANALNECMRKMSDKTEVLSLPTFVLEIPGLTLAGAQLLTTKSDGKLQIMFRFRLIMGNLCHLFKHDLGFNNDLPDRTSQMSAAILADIALPLLNICAAAEAGIVTAENERADLGERLVERSHEIIFHVELIKRFVQQSTYSAEAVDAPLVHQQDRAHPALSRSARAYTN